MRSFLLLLTYILAFVGSNLCFKKAGLFPSATTPWWIWFSLGNIIGFFAPVSITMALKGESATWIFAVAIGLSFLTLQLSLWFLQAEPFQRIQGLGIFFIAVGLILVQWGKSS
ncbi:MAG: hypothetical protein V4507_07695 [Verrucomicrobiota bacterium]